MRLQSLEPSSNRQGLVSCNHVHKQLGSLTLTAFSSDHDVHIDILVLLRHLHVPTYLVSLAGFIKASLMPKH